VLRKDDAATAIVEMQTCALANFAVVSVLNSGMAGRSAKAANPKEAQDALQTIH
jgi:hypothetical protein